MIDQFINFVIRPPRYFVVLVVSAIISVNLIITLGTLVACNLVLLMHMELWV